MKNATDIAARLGHSDPAFTLRRYVHADRTKLAEPPSALEALRKRERVPIGREEKATDVGEGDSPGGS